MAEPDDAAPAAAGHGPVGHGDRDETRIRVYQRLMDAQEQIAAARHVRGVEHAAVEVALDAAETGPTPAERAEDLYLSSLAHYVNALGGRLEIRAVFADDTVTIDPGHSAER